MTRTVLGLSGDAWRLGQAPVGAVPGAAAWGELEQVTEWLPATVPGNVRADLVKAGQLPELDVGLHAESSRWVDDHCWWLVRDFALDPAPGERVHLVLRGVDYVSDLFLNGHHLGRHEGMYSPQLHDVTTLVQERHQVGLAHRLAVRIVGSRWLPQDRSSRWEKTLNEVEDRATSQSTRYPHRRDVLKCQMSFGWDFAPPLLTMGIWDDVQTVTTGPTFIQGVTTRPWLEGASARLSIGLDIDARAAHPARLICRLRGETFEADPVAVEESVELPVGASGQSLELLISEPRLWWPWDHGRPDLYRLEVEVWDGAQLLDSVSQTIGLRQVELDGWTLKINGRPVFCRGANWVPVDILPGQVTRVDYEALLDLARQANMNMLRVWGGGLREKQSFYDTCDRLGILVWQEFPFACAFLTRYPRSGPYLELVEKETRAMVCALRNHASLVLWCGGNEFDPGRNEPLVSTLARVAAEQDPSRPFRPASPAGGDSHNWRVWHRFEPPSTYLQDQALFASEFGLQAPPSVDTLERFIPADDLWPPGPSWAYHGAGLEKLRRYAAPYLKAMGASAKGEASSLETFVQASQRAQARGLQMGIEHYRRRKAEGGGGVLIWQLNEPWPAISWALVDHYRQPKPAYEMVKRLLRPVLVSLEYESRTFQEGDKFRATVFVMNDLAEEQAGCRLEVVLKGAAGQVVERSAWVLTVAALSAAAVAQVRWTLPLGGSWRVECRLMYGDQALSTNDYDLTIYDDLGPGLRQRLWNWLTNLVVPD